MSPLTIFFTLLCYLAVAIFTAGVTYKLYRYIRTPQVLRIPLTPAPKTYSGVASRLFCEVFFFSSLFKASRWAWVFGWVFHAAFLVLLLRHAHYFFTSPSAWMFQIQAYSSTVALLMLAGVAGLWARRLLVDRIRYITAPSDHLMLALITGIGLSGIALKATAPQIMLAAKNFVRGLMYIDWYPFPPSWLFGIHIFLVASLLIIFPFSKLMHAPGVVFNPVFNQRDRAR